MADTQAQFLALKASAGSGKTFNLALRFIYLLFCGAKVHQILTLTFTKKASNEMRHRIYEQLHLLFMSFKQNTYSENLIYKALREKGLSHQMLYERIGVVYNEFIRSNPRITTIDAFFHTVLKKFCWYVGVSVYFEVGNTNQSSIDEIFLKRLHTNQIDEIVEFCFYNGLRIKDFLQLLHNLSLLPTQDIENAFANKADNVSHISFKSIEEAIRVRMKKIDDYIQSVEDGHKSLKKGFYKDSIQAIIDSPNYLLQWSDHSQSKKFDFSAFDNDRKEILASIQMYFAKKEQEALKQLEQYFRHFNRAKHIHNSQENVLSFTDVMLKNYELLALNDDRDFFYFRLDDKITHILLDEFQDTSLTQYQILYPLIHEIYSGNGRINDRSLFIVGDEKQSIYMFRGSFAAVFEEATKSFTQENLPFNYRSSQRVIAFNNHTFAKYYKNYIPQECPQDSKKEQGYVRVLEVAADNESLQMQVYNEVEALLHKGADENDIAILVFKNDDASLLKEYINAQNPHIHIITQASASLFEKKEVKILIYALTYIHLHTQLVSQDSNSAEGRARQISNALKLYEKKLCKLLGKSYADSKNIVSKINTIPRSSNMPISQVVLMLIEMFNIAHSACMLFLELSCEYASIESLLDEIPKLQCNAPTQSNNGVKIMTIHKSKGLEFKYVILCDRLSQSQANNDKFIYEYEGTHIKHIYYKMKGRENFDKQYNQALEAHKKRLEREEYNVLYVAFTRAKFGLSIAQKAKGSAFGILQLDTKGDEIPSLCNLQDAQATQVPLYILENMSSFGRQEVFLKYENEQEGILSMEQWHNIIFGNALHSVFEWYLGYGIAQEDVYHILLNRYGFALSDESISQAIKSAIGCIQSETFTALKKGKNIMCEVSYIAEGCLYRIDVLLYDDREWIVLDYKSGAANKETQAEQVKGYMKFLNTLDTKQNKDIRGFIVYPLKKPDGQFCEVHL